MPRPETENSSVPRNGSTRRATFLSSSRSSRSRRWRLVRYFPSRPANGEVFTPKVIFSVGSSTFSRGSAPGRLGVGHRVADLHPFQPHHGADVAGVDLLDLDAAEVLEHVDRDDLGPA